MYDICINNAKIVDVFSAKIFNGSLLADKGRIVSFSYESTHPHSQQSHQQVDAAGAYLLPGLIDSHVHIESSMLCPARFAELVLPFGTTTVVADPHEIANVQGLAGLRYMLEASRMLPLDVRIMLPSCVPALPFELSGATLIAADLLTLMDDPGVGGLGEMMNIPGVLNKDADVMAKIGAALSRGKPVDGHSPRLSGVGLDSYLGAGISTDHECSTVEEMQERISRGAYVLMREGSATRDLLKLLPGLTSENSRRCLMCTDDRHSADILERGHLNNHLRIAVAHGVEPITAIRMSSLNAAECYGLHRKGGLAPGWAADFFLVNNLKDFTVLDVWAKGRHIAHAGQMLESLYQLDPGPLMYSVNLAAPLPEDLFRVSVPSGRARVIGILPHSLITPALELDVATNAQGDFDFALNPGIIKVAVLERHHATGQHFTALLDKNYGLRGGAIATSIAHDSHNIVVAGDNDADMRLAVQEVARLQGGVVMVASGKVVDSLHLPVGGLMGTQSAQEIAQKLTRLMGLAHNSFHITKDADAFMLLSFLALPVIPELKVTPQGLFDVHTFSFVPLEA